MLKTQVLSYDTGLEPAPDFASDAEIALAIELRLRLEARYFGRPAEPVLLLVRPEKEH
jgi:hypothetical protein